MAQSKAPIFWCPTSPDRDQGSWTPCSKALFLPEGWGERKNGPALLDVARKAGLAIATPQPLIMQVALPHSRSCVRAQGLDQRACCSGLKKVATDRNGSAYLGGGGGYELHLAFKTIVPLFPLYSLLQVP